MRFAGGGASLCVTHRCASLAVFFRCKCSLPLAPLLSSSVANGVDKKKVSLPRTEDQKRSGSVTGMLTESAINALEGMEGEFAG